MSHPEQIAFLELVARANPGVVQGGRVLEIGSYDVNGSMRRVFHGAARYVGVDLVEGPGVDVVAFGHEVDFAPSSFDLAVSGECFEHDPHWRQTFMRMIEVTRPGGIVAFTCASSGRPEHGTRRTKTTDSPGTQFEGLDYYRNLSEHDFSASVDLAEHFASWSFHYMPTSMDLYFAGVRRGDPTSSAALPDPEDVTAIATLMPVAHRVVRVPLRIAQRVVPEHSYQDFAVRYWTRMERAFGRMAGR